MACLAAATCAFVINPAGARSSEKKVYPQLLRLPIRDNLLPLSASNAPRILHLRWTKKSPGQGATTFNYQLHDLEQQ